MATVDGSSSSIDTDHDADAACIVEVTGHLMAPRYRRGDYMELVFRPDYRAFTSEALERFDALIVRGIVRALGDDGVERGECDGNSDSNNDDDDDAGDGTAAAADPLVRLTSVSATAPPADAPPTAAATIDNDADGGGSSRKRKRAAPSVRRGDRPKYLLLRVDRQLVSVLTSVFRRTFEWHARTGRVGCECDVRQATCTVGEVRALIRQHSMLGNRGRTHAPLPRIFTRDMLTQLTRQCRIAGGFTAVKGKGGAGAAARALDTVEAWPLTARLWARLTQRNTALRELCAQSLLHGYFLLMTLPEELVDAPLATQPRRAVTLADYQRRVAVLMRVFGAHDVARLDSGALLRLIADVAGPASPPHAVLALLFRPDVTVRGATGAGARPVNTHGVHVRTLAHFRELATALEPLVARSADAPPATNRWRAGARAAAKFDNLITPLAAVLLRCQTSDYAEVSMTGAMTHMLGALARGGWIVVDGGGASATPSSHPATVVVVRTCTAAALHAALADAFARHIDVLRVHDMPRFMALASVYEHVLAAHVCGPRVDAAHVSSALVLWVSPAGARASCYRNHHWLRAMAAVHPPYAAAAATDDDEGGVRRAPLHSLVHAFATMPPPQHAPVAAAAAAGAVPSASVGAYMAHWRTAGAGTGAGRQAESGMRAAAAHVLDCVHYHTSETSHDPFAGAKRVYIVLDGVAHFSAAEYVALTAAVRALCAARRQPCVLAHTIVPSSSSATGADEDAPLATTASGNLERLALQCTPPARVIDVVHGADSIVPAMYAHVAHRGAAVAALHMQLCVRDGAGAGADGADSDDVDAWRYATVQQQQPMAPPPDGGGGGLALLPHNQTIECYARLEDAVPSAFRLALAITATAGATTGAPAAARAVRQRRAEAALASASPAGPRVLTLLDDVVVVGGDDADGDGRYGTVDACVAAQLALPHAGQLRQRAFRVGDPVVVRGRAHGRVRAIGYITALWCTVGGRTRRELRVLTANESSAMNKQVRVRRVVRPPDTGTAAATTMSNEAARPHLVDEASFSLCDVTLADARVVCARTVPAQLAASFDTVIVDVPAVVAASTSAAACTSALRRAIGLCRRRLVLVVGGAHIDAAVAPAAAVRVRAIARLLVAAVRARPPGAGGLLRWRAQRDDDCAGAPKLPGAYLLRRFDAARNSAAIRALDALAALERPGERPDEGPDDGPDDGGSDDDGYGSSASATGSSSSAAGSPPASPPPPPAARQPYSGAHNN
jgi:hypothetical protein